MANETFGGPFPAYIASKQAVDFGAMVAGMATAQITVEGASPGDGVLVCRPSTSVVTDSIALMGYCDTADKVDVTALHNDATDTTNLASVTLTVVVFPA